MAPNNRNKQSRQGNATPAVTVQRSSNNDTSPAKLATADAGKDLKVDVSLAAVSGATTPPTPKAEEKEPEVILPPQSNPVCAKFVSLATAYIKLLQNTVNRTQDVDKRTAMACSRMSNYLLANQTPAVCQLMWDLHVKYADTLLSDRNALQGIRFLSGRDAEIVRHVYNDYRFYVKRKSGTLDRHGLTRQGINCFQMLAFLEQKGKM